MKLSVCTAQHSSFSSTVVSGEQDLKSFAISVLTGMTQLGGGVGRGAGSNVCW